MYSTTFWAENSPLTLSPKCRISTARHLPLRVAISDDKRCIFVHLAKSAMVDKKTGQSEEFTWIHQCETIHRKKPRKAENLWYLDISLKFIKYHWILLLSSFASNHETASGFSQLTGHYWTTFLPSQNRNLISLDNSAVLQSKEQVTWDYHGKARDLSNYECGQSQSHFPNLFGIRWNPYLIRRSR